MNIYNFIERSLHGISGVPGGDTGSLAGFASHTANVGSLPTPIRQCEIVCRIDFGSDGTLPTIPLFVTSLTLPEVGVSWNNQSDMMFPIPSAEVKYAQIGCFIPRSFQGNIMNLYTRQFRNGLIAIDIVRPTMTFDIISHEESDYSDNMVGAVNEVVSKMRDSAPDNVPSISYDDGYGNFVVGSESTRLELPDDTADTFIPYCSISKCWFSQPKFSADPSSSELADVRMDVAFEDITYKNLRRIGV